VNLPRFSKTCIDMGAVDVIRVPHGLKENGFEGVILAGDASRHA
jgi:hypothetical protein